LSGSEVHFPEKVNRWTSHLHLSMAAAQPIASTFDWKQAIVFLAFFVPLHSVSMLPDAQVVPPPQDTFPDCRMLLHSATSAAMPPAESFAADTPDGATATELSDRCFPGVGPVPPRIGAMFSKESSEVSAGKPGRSGGGGGGTNLPGGT